MKLPKTFRPEKDLDYKTNQMIEEAHVFKKITETSPGNTDLEKILQYEDEHFKYFKSDIFHNLITDLASKSDYRLSRNEFRHVPYPMSPRTTYWHWKKEDDYDNQMVNVFTRRYRLKGIRRYSYAKVPKSLMKNDYFYKQFQKYADIYSLLYEDTLRLAKPLAKWGPAFIIPSMIAGGISFLYAFTLAPEYNILTKILIASGGCALGGIFGGAGYVGAVKAAKIPLAYLCQKRKEKFAGLLPYFTMNDREALEQAFT